MPPVEIIKRLNTMVDRNLILTGLGIAVNKVPELNTCPVCKHTTLHTGHGFHSKYRMYCGHPTCGCSGDPFEVYAAARHLELAHAVRELLGKKMRYVKAADVKNYVEACRKLTQQTTVFWKTAREQMIQAPGESPGLETLLERFGLRDLVAEAVWPRRLGLFLGTATVGRMNQLGMSLSGKTDRRVLITPICWMPGEIIGYAAFDIWHHNLVCQVNENGPAWLRSLDIYNQEVFVLGDHATALAVQIDRQRRFNAIPPVISYHQVDTGLDNFHAAKCYIWDPEEPIRAYTLAARMENAYVATRPQPTAMPHQADNAGNLLAAIKRAARPWLESLCEFLTGNQPYQERLTTLMSLKLQPEQVHQLVELTPLELRHELGELLDACNTNNVLSISSNVDLVDKLDGWYELGPDRQERLVTEAVPVVTNCVNFEDGHTILQGYIRYQQQHIQFSVDPQKTRNTAEWLRSTVAATGGYPYVRDGKLIKHALNHSIRLYSPVTSIGVNRVGWNDRLRIFSFKNFSVSDTGELITMTCVADHPSSELEYAKLDDFSWMTEPAGADTVALLIGTLTQLAAATRDHGQPVMVTAEDQAGSTCACSAWCQACKIPQYQVTHAQSWYQYVNAMGRHRYPAALEEYCDTNAALRSLITADTMMVIPVDQLLHAAINCADGWVTVRVEGLLPAKIPALLPYMLVECAKLGLFNGEYTCHQALARVLTTLYQWCRVKNIKNTALQLAAKQVTASSDLPAANRFIRLLRLLVKHGYLRPNNDKQLSAGNGILIATDSVTINWQCVRAAAQKARIPLLLDRHAVTRILKAGDLLLDIPDTHLACEWVISYQAWALANS